MADLNTWLCLPEEKYSMKFRLGGKLTLDCEPVIRDQPLEDQQVSWIDVDQLQACAVEILVHVRHAPDRFCLDFDVLFIREIVREIDAQLEDRIHFQREVALHQRAACCHVDEISQ